MNEITPEIMMAIQLNIIVNRTMATSIFPYTLFSVGDITGLWNLIHVNHIKININSLNVLSSRDSIVLYGFTTSKYTVIPMIQILPQISWRIGTGAHITNTAA